MISRNFATGLSGFITFLAATPLFAHHAMGGETPLSFAGGLLSGLAHPVIGVDHLLFLLVTGVLLFTLSRPLAYLITGVFVGGTLLGTVLHLMAVNLPLAEVIIAVSLVCGGLMLFLRKGIDPSILGLFFVGSGVFHGYAYGESIIGAEAMPLGAYLLGFSLTQFVVVTAISLVVRQVIAKASLVILPTERVVGGMAVAGGVFFLVSSLS